MKYLVEGKTVGTKHFYAVVNEANEVFMVGDDKLLLLLQYDEIEDKTEGAA